MDLEPALLAALHDAPGDEAPWLVLADWLEEQGQASRAELVRLQLTLRQPVLDGVRDLAELRLQELLRSGVRPCVPELVNSIGLRLALIPAGTFWMGSPADEPDRYPDESPRHRVTLTRPFYLGLFPVTQAQWQAVQGGNPCWFAADGGGAAEVGGEATADWPVDSATWEDADAFCRALSALPAERAAGRVYRLPTEAEWEYACRAGTTTAYSVGPQLTDRDATFASAAVGPRHPTRVGTFPANPWGVHDLHGNVWEWCHDWWGEYYYERSPAEDPPGPDGGIGHVIRGGAWGNSARYCRSACRYRVPPCEHGVGFRVALTAG